MGAGSRVRRRGSAVALNYCVCVSGRELFVLWRVATDTRVFFQFCVPFAVVAVVCVGLPSVVGVVFTWHLFNLSTFFFFFFLSVCSLLLTWTWCWYCVLVLVLVML